jgi:hypothetical protein
MADLRRRLFYIWIIEILCIRDGPLDIWGGGGRNPPQKIEQAFNLKKNRREENLKKKIRASMSILWEETDSWTPIWNFWI